MKWNQSIRVCKQYCVAATQSPKKLNCFYYITSSDSHMMLETHCQSAV